MVELAAWALGCPALAAIEDSMGALNRKGIKWNKKFVN
jgi:hypothetical protein